MLTLSSKILVFFTSAVNSVIQSIDAFKTKLDMLQIQLDASFYTVSEPLITLPRHTFTISFVTMTR